MLHGKRVVAAIVILLFGILIMVSCSSPQRPRAQQHPYIAIAKAFLASPEGGGKQNALSNYIRAMEKFNTGTYRRHEHAFQQILKNGWTGKEQKAMAALRALQPVLKEIRRGNEKAFVRYPATESWSSPIPDFLKLQMLGRLMIIQALYCEHINRSNDALDWYKQSLVFAQRMCDTNSFIIAKMISTHIEKNALEALQRFLIRQHLNQDVYSTVAGTLTRLRSSDTAYLHALRNENRANYNMLEDMEVGSEEWEKLDAADKEKMRFIIANKDRVLKQYKEFNDQLELVFKKDYPEILKTDLEPLMAERPPHCEISPSTLRESYLREGVTYAWWALTTATAQACAYRAQKGSLPQDMAALSEMGMIPLLDPFSNQRPAYIVSGRTATLYSIGPDLIDGKAKLEYDPTNGLISAGDITLNLQ